MLPAPLLPSPGTPAVDTLTRVVSPDAPGKAVNAPITIASAAPAGSMALRTAEWQAGTKVMLCFLPGGSPQYAQSCPPSVCSGYGCVSRTSWRDNLPPLSIQSFREWRYGPLVRNLCLDEFRE